MADIADSPAPGYLVMGRERGVHNYLIHHRIENPQCLEVIQRSNYVDDTAERQ
jgi:hypothetical protein